MVSSKGLYVVGAEGMNSRVTWLMANSKYS